MSCVPPRAPSARSSPPGIFAGSRWSYLATVGCDDLHRAVVYDWAVGAVAAVTPTHQEKPLALVFNRAGAGFGGGVGFALGGRGVLAVWTCTGQSAAREPVRLGS